MVSVALPDLPANQPRRVSSWTYAEKGKALRVAMAALAGVGERDQVHVERASYIWVWRRMARMDETLLLPDVGIAGDYKRKLLGL